MKQLSPASAAGTILEGMVYDITGSYRPALMAMPVLLGAFKNVEE